jgi:hypothetical protein
VFALLHPTDADIAPVPLFEAAFFGCPSLVVGNFALHEVTKEHNRSLLLPHPFTSDVFASVLLNLLCNPGDYEKARHSARVSAMSMRTQVKLNGRQQEAILKAFRET